MCSGCSGNYADDFANPDDDPLWDEAERLPAVDRAPESFLQPQAPAESEALDSWEVLVSGQRIVEIRFVAPPDLEEVALPRGDKIARTELVPGEQSTFASAKSYPTRSSSPFVRAQKPTSGATFLPFAVSALAVAGMALWLLLS